MKRIIVATLVLALSACGGDGDKQSIPTPTEPPAIYQHLKAPLPATEKLHYASAEQLETLLKNGVRLDSAMWGDIAVDGMLRDNAAAENLPAPQPSAAPNSEAGYSQTNVQVSGVDEADYVKYDGQYLYVRHWPNYDDISDTGGVRVLQTNAATAEVAEVSDIGLGEELNFGNLELYLLMGDVRADALATLQSGGDGLFYPMESLLLDTPVYSQQTSITLKLHDLTEPADPQLGWQLELDGRLHDSRKIGDMLYLVTSHFPQIPELYSRDSRPFDEDDIEAVLGDTPLESLFPSYSINGGEPELLGSGDGCLVGTDDSGQFGYSRQHYIVAIDLRHKAVTQAVCLATPVLGIYSSTGSLYLGASQWSNDWDSSYTVVHKFDLNEEGIRYAATGSVPGNLGWASPSFRMDEFDNRLRIITSSGWGTNVDHRLWVLEEDSDKQSLELVAQLPREDAPSPIGKPGEDIYAVRFFGERAYVVTFERIDPLYVIDLSNAELPVIAGELELPGFSTYLHPLGDDYVFGFGRAASEEGVQLGLKAALFDVRDITNPQVVNEVAMGGRWSWSDALYDHKAFNFLRTAEDAWRISFPATLSNDDFSWLREDIDDGDAQVDIQSLSVVENNSRVLVLLEANALGSEQAELRLHGSLQSGNSDDRQWWQYSAFGRGILHGDAVFYVGGLEVWTALWTNPGNILGPY